MRGRLAVRHHVDRDIDDLIERLNRNVALHRTDLGELRKEYLSNVW
jgi:hypothetical protein